MIVTKGMGSNRLITGGYGYTFGRAQILQYFSGGGGSVSVRRRRRYWQDAQDDQPGQWLARRPVVPRRLPDDGFVGIFEDELPQTVSGPFMPSAALEPRKGQPIVIETGLAPVQLQVIRHGLSTATKVALVACVVGVAGVAFYLIRKSLQRNERSSSCTLT